jgi:hypothetical protein
MIPLSSSPRSRGRSRSALAALSTYTQTAGVTVLNGGRLTVTAFLPLVSPPLVSAASSVVIFPLRGVADIQGGTLAGSGTIDANVQNAGQVDVGGAGAAGLLIVTGNYTQTAAGTLNMKLGGYDPGTKFDQLQIGGVARLAGTLNVTLLPDFTPEGDDFFQVIRSSFWQPATPWPSTVRTSTVCSSSPWSPMATSASGLCRFSAESLSRLLSRPRVVSSFGIFSAQLPRQKRQMRTLPSRESIAALAAGAT